MEGSKVMESRALPRCSICRLPTETLARVHEDRLRLHLTLEEITGVLRDAGHNVSDSALRRHLGRHLPEGAYSGIPSASTSGNGHEPVSTAFDNLVGKELDGHAVLEAGTQTLVEMMQALVRDYRATAGRGPQASERV